MNKAAQAYMSTQVNTTTQGDLVVLLYEGAINYLKKAKQKIREKDFANKGLLISKALDIIGELDCSLNGQKGGELAQNLHDLYCYCSTRLLAANMELDEGKIDEVINILSGLSSAFKEISGQVNGQQPPATETQVSS